MSSPLERGKRRAAARQRAANEVFAEILTKDVDVETLFLQKLDQRTRGGTAQLLQAFRKLDQYTGDNAGISFKEFKTCLEKFGLQGLRDKDALKLFKKYDTDNSGTIDWNEFAAQVGVSFSKHKEIGETSNDIQDAKRYRERMRRMKIQADRTKWKTISIDAENLLLKKIDQRLKGGPNQLRLAFKKFNTSTEEDSAIDFKEFQRTLENLGLQGLEKGDMKALFNKFDSDGNGTIDFNEFVDNVMKSRASHSSLSLSCTGERDNARLKDRAKVISKRNTKMYWKYYGGDIDGIEKILMDKIRQKTKGGPHELRRAFGIFDKNRNDKADISFRLFIEGLKSLGISGIPERQAKKLFDRYDKSGDGLIDFREFMARVDYALIPDTQKPTEQRRRRQCCKHCCCHHKKYAPPKRRNNPVYEELAITGRKTA